MRYILIIAMSLLLSDSRAQDDEDETVKPSWSADMPELHDAPDMDLNSAVDTEIDFGMEDLDRRDLFNDTDDESIGTSDITADGLSLNDDENNQSETDEQAEADQLAIEQAAAEQQAKKDADKLAREKAITDQSAKDQALAEQLAKEQAIADQLANEQAIADQLAKEQALAEQLAKEQALAEVENTAIEQTNTDQPGQEQPNNVQSTSTSDQNIAIYKWIKIKNVAPKYPLRAARSSEEGWVEVITEIDPNGKVVSAKAVNTYRNSKTFIRSAVDAVMEWEFDPPINYGISENQYRNYKILFKL